VKKSDVGKTVDIQWGTKPRGKEMWEVLEAYESPAPDCPSQRKSSNTYNPPFQVLLWYFGFVVMGQKNPRF